MQQVSLYTSNENRRYFCDVALASEPPSPTTNKQPNSENVDYIYIVDVEMQIEARRENMIDMFYNHVLGPRLERKESWGRGE